ILPGGNWLTYQSNQAIYVAQLDSRTGDVFNPQRVDSGAARLLETFNGPEFGVDAQGWAIFYAKPSQDEISIWRASPDANGGFRTEAITQNASYLSQLASRNAQAEHTRLAAIRESWQAGTAVWLDESDGQTGGEIAAIENGVSSVRWVDDSFLLTFSQRSGPAQGQVHVLDTTSNQITQISTDDGDKTDPYGWFAPEYNGELLILAIVDNSSIAVYHAETGERLATFRPPPSASFDFVSSAEPFVVDGRSYMSLVIKDANNNRQRFTDSEVWLFGLDDYAERCDSGESGLARSDPEVFIGTSAVFVYYNVINGPSAPYEMRRCQSNIPLGASSAQTQSTPTCQNIPAQSTNAALTQNMAPYVVCHQPTQAQQNHLLVFLPGTGATPSDYQAFVQEAANMGMHAIGLTYPNDRSVNLQICLNDPDPDCHAKVRYEVITGQDTHADVNVNMDNSITGRLMALLTSLHASQPTAGWAQYIDGDQPRWESIVIAGHSQGAGMAAYIAHEHIVARAVLFAWVDIARGRAVNWILDSPPATPAERIYHFEHVDDRARGEFAKEQMFAAWGLNRLGQVEVDRVAPPYEDAHLLLTALAPARQTARPSAGAHNMVVADDFTPMENGQAVLAPVWRYLLGQP
ncbi:MAG: BPSS1187 family protein, partial [Anaerolineales bacterium]